MVTTYIMFKLDVLSGKILTAGDGYVGSNDGTRSSSDDEMKSNQSLKMYMSCNTGVTYRFKKFNNTTIR